MVLQEVSEKTMEAHYYCILCMYFLKSIRIDHCLFFTI